jgi:hypothetical protein
MVRRPKTVREIIRRIPLVRRDTERVVPQDLLARLQLIDKGKVLVSDKTFHPSSAPMDGIVRLLRDGDFYEIERNGEMGWGNRPDQKLHLADTTASLKAHGTS